MTIATSSKLPKGYIGKPCLQTMSFFFFSAEFKRYSCLCFVGGIVPKCLLPRRKTGLFKRRPASSALRNGLLKAKAIFYEDFFIKTINIIINIIINNKQLSLC